MKKLLSSNRGFTLIQVVVAIVGLAIAASVALKVTSQGTAEGRTILSITRIHEVQRAIGGDERVKDNTDFGFVGDFGRLPATLDELIVDNGDPNWNGSYLTSDFVGDNTSTFVDAWGNDFVYDNTTGELGLSEASVGEVPVIIPAPYENIEEILFGSIEGSIVDKYNNPPKKGDRKDLILFMEPIIDENNWPPIVYDPVRDRRIFHTERMWPFFHPVWNVIHVFSDPRDHGRDHWRWLWRWAGLNFMAAQMIRTGDLRIDGSVDEGVGLSNFSEDLSIEIERI